MTDVPAHLAYTAEHEWVDFDHDDPALARVGITAHAADTLGDLVFVDLPSSGSTVEAGQACGALESTKTVGDLYAPLTGEVIAVNTALIDDPAAVNVDAYGAGWLFAVRITGRTPLLSAAEYRALIENGAGARP